MNIKVEDILDRMEMSRMGKEKEIAKYTPNPNKHNPDDEDLSDIYLCSSLKSAVDLDGTSNYSRVH